MPSPAFQPLPLEDLRRLVAAAARGDERAQQEMHARYFHQLESTLLPQAYRFAYIERGDLLNDLWIALFDHDAKKLLSIELRSEPSLLAYLKLMMRRHCRDQARKETRLVLTDPSLLDRVFSPNASLEDVLITDELVALIQEELTQDELAVWNHWMRDRICDRKEIARRMGKTSNYVHQVIHRIREKIRKRFMLDQQ